MKYLKIFISGLLFLFILGFIFLSFYAGPGIDLDTAGKFEYEPLKSIELNQFEKKKQYVSLSDGTQIAANIFLPTISKSEKVPTIFIFTPYNRSIVLPDLAWWEKAGAKAFTGSWGPVFNGLPNRKTLNTLTHSGYAVVVADMRGTGASSGFTSAMSPQLRKDGIEMINWIAEQNWSDGKVGMQGPSYLGWIQLAIASEQPDALKCISPSIMGSDIYTEAQKQGGILMTKWVKNFNKQLRLLNLNALDRKNKMPVFPAEPVIDEDGDGEIMDEIPLYTDSAEPLFVTAEKPTYADGVVREKNIYFNHSKDHLKNIWTEEIAKDWKYRDDKIVVYDDTMSLEDISPGFFIPAIKESKIPILMTGGWFDGFEGVTKLYASLQGENPAHFVMAPRFHMPMTVPPAYKELFDYQGEYEDQLLSLRIQFFDFYLKGKENGFDKIDPVQLYTCYKGWESFDHYPPKATTYKTLFLNEKNQLTQDSSENGSDVYEVDFSHASDYDAEKDNRWNMATTTDSLMIRTQLDKKCIVYETPVLENNWQVTGHTIVELFISSNQNDADVYVYLSDVAEDGTVYYVSEGQLRAGWHRQVEDDEQVNFLYDIKPDLPWHGFDKGGYHDNPLANDTIVSMRFDLTPTSWVFQKGHKLRVSIAGADFENFEFNPKLCPDGKLENCRATQLNIHRGRTQMSKIELPILK
ncbi:MAG: CocE/NonD family hydrolase [Saprospiraceae bacterium]